MKKTLAATAAVSMLVFTAACGGGGRPSVDEVADALQEEGDFDDETFDDEAIDCIAKKFHESDISDEALQALVDGDEDYEASDDDEKAATDVAGELADCVSA